MDMMEFDRQVYLEKEGDGPNVPSSSPSVLEKAAKVRKLNEGHRYPDGSACCSAPVAEQAQMSTRKFKFKCTNRKDGALNIDEMEVDASITLGSLYIQLTEKMDKIVNEKNLGDALQSKNVNWKFWAKLEGISGSINNIFGGDKPLDNLIVGKAFPKEEEVYTVKLMKGPKIDAAQKEYLQKKYAQEAAEAEQKKLAKLSGHLVDMKGYEKLGMKFNTDGSVNMEKSVGSMPQGKDREYLECKFYGHDGGDRRGGGFHIGAIEILGQRREMDPAERARQDRYARELAERATVAANRPLSAPQTSWPPRMEVVEDAEEIRTVGQLFDYARKEKVMRVAVEETSNDMAQDVPKPRAILSVKAAVQLTRGTIDNIVRSPNFDRTVELPRRPGGSQEVFDPTTVHQFKNVWNRLFVLEGGADSVDVEEAVTADQLIDEYARALGGGWRVEPERGFVHRAGAIARNGENADAFATGRSAIRKFFHAYASSDKGYAVRVSSMEFNGSEVITEKVNGLLKKGNSDSALSLDSDSRMKYKLYKPNLQYSVDERSYGEYLYWAEMKQDYERTWDNPVELPQWGFRKGHKVRVFTNNALDIFPRDRVGIDPRNGHFFHGFGPTTNNQRNGPVTLFTTIGATQKTRAKLGLLMMYLLGRSEGPEKQNHMVTKKFMENIRGDEKRGAAVNAGTSVQQQADMDENDPWGNADTEIDLPHIADRNREYTSRVTHYTMTMTLGNTAELKYMKPGGLGGGTIARWRVYQDRSSATIFEVDHDSWTGDKSFNWGGHGEFGVTTGIGLD